MEIKLRIPLEAFRDKDSRNFVQGNTPKKFQSVETQIWETLKTIDAAGSVWELGQRRGLRFKKLHAMKWQYSVRVNEDYRICFDWGRMSSHPTNIEINNHYNN